MHPFSSVDLLIPVGGQHNKALLAVSHIFSVWFGFNNVGSPSKKCLEQIRLSLLGSRKPPCNACRLSSFFQFFYFSVFFFPAGNGKGL